MATIDITLQTAVDIHTVAAAPSAAPAVGFQDASISTTAWQLHADTISHSFRNTAIALPLPAPGGSVGVEGSEDELRNMMIDLGFRSEQIKLTGVLVDRGTPSASNPRKQTLLDIARTQFSVTINANGQRGANASTENPNAYVLLTIGSGVEPSDPANGYTEGTQTITNDTNTGGTTTPKAYRGMITEFTFNMSGGKPDIWHWNMTFYTIQNEHDW